MDAQIWSVVQLRNHLHLLRQEETKCSKKFDDGSIGCTEVKELDYNELFGGHRGATDRQVSEGTVEEVEGSEVKG